MDMARMIKKGTIFQFINVLYKINKLFTKIFVHSRSLGPSFEYFCFA